MKFKDMPSGIKGSCTILEKNYTIHTSEINRGEFNLLIASFPFWCPICGILVKAGDNYIDDKGSKTCLCLMPEKPQRRLKTTGVKRLKTY